MVLICLNSKFVVFFYILVLGALRTINESLNSENYHFCVFLINFLFSSSISFYRLSQLSYNCPLTISKLLFEGLKAYREEQLARQLAVQYRHYSQLAAEASRLSSSLASRVER